MAEARERGNATGKRIEDPVSAIGKLTGKGALTSSRLPRGHGCYSSRKAMEGSTRVAR